MNQSWDEFRAAIAKEFAAHPQDFLRQPTIARTMHPDQRDLAAAYANGLGHTSFGEKLMERAKDAICGKPWDHINGRSMSALQHAWQLYKLWEHFSLTPSMLHYVAEIGGGYGDMCRQMYAGGAPQTYDIFDFPELHAIQRAYLESCCVKPSFRELTPAKLECSRSKSLLLATFSVSEMPLAQRAALEPSFYGYHYLVLSWNESFAGIANAVWFGGLAERLHEKFRVTVTKDPHMRGWYLFGERR